MKKIITIALSVISLNSYSQINADIGFSSRISLTGKLGYEIPINGFNIEPSIRVTIDNYHPIIGLQTGYSFIVDRYNQELRLAVGGFYHTALLPADLSKTERIQTVRFGGSIRFKWSVNVYCVAEYNGETMSAGIGYLFTKRQK